MPSSYRRVQSATANIKKAFKDKLVNDLLPTDREEYQACREQQGASPATIDMELRISQTAMSKAFYNNMHDGSALKTSKL